MSTLPDGRAVSEHSALALLEAVVAMSSDLDLPGVLQRIVVSAATLTGARYGALGVIGSDGLVSDFHTTGVDPAERERIGAPPHGRGILGLLITHPQPLRLQDLQAHPQSFGFPPNHPAMRTFLGVPVRVRGTVFGNLYLTEKAGGAAFTDEDVVVVGALAAAAGSVIENARAYRLSERRRQWLEASALLTEALQPPIETGQALERLAATARSVSHARAVAVATHDPTEPVAALAADPADARLVTAVVDAVLARTDTDPWGLLEVTLEGCAVVAVPLRAQVASGGLLVTLHDRPHVAAPEELELLAVFAEQAGLALDRAQAVTDREELAVVLDRERIARDLHDVVIQRLFATGLQLQAVGTRVPEELQPRIDDAVDALDMTITDIRSTIFELKQPAATSLRAGVHDLVGEYVGPLGFQPAVRTVGPVDSTVPEGVRAHLLPVLREALSNVAHHARATSAEITVAAQDGELRLTVADDGVGLDDKAAESGLRNARRRAAELGGTFALAPRAPRGAVFEWRVPLG